MVLGMDTITKFNNGENGADRMPQRLRDMFVHDQVAEIAARLKVNRNNGLSHGVFGRSLLVESKSQEISDLLDAFVEKTTESGSFINLGLLIKKHTKEINTDHKQAVYHSLNGVALGILNLLSNETIDDPETRQSISDYIDEQIFKGYPEYKSEDDKINIKWDDELHVEVPKSLYTTRVSFIKDVKSAIEDVNPAWLPHDDLDKTQTFDAV